jgi:hypothetical protein
MIEVASVIEQHSVRHSVPVVGLVSASGSIVVVGFG